jgi:hypothetical protein
MKKHCISVGMPVLAALFAISIALVSCSEYEPVPFPYDLGLEELYSGRSPGTTGKIDDCRLPEHNYCEEEAWEEPSSSSENNEPGPGGGDSSDSQGNVPSSSSSQQQQQQSSSSAGSNTQSSSSNVRSSSSFSSNSTARSSSSGTTITPTVTLTCGSVGNNAIYTVGQTISKPTLTCSNGASASNQIWSDAPIWESAVAGEFGFIKVKADCGSDGGLNATCSGKITVNAATPSSSSTNTPSSSSGGNSGGGGGPTIGDSTPTGTIPQGQIDVTSGQCVSIALTWNNASYEPTVKFSCQNANNTTNFSTTGSATCSGQYGFSNCEVAKISNGQTVNWSICVTFSGTGSAKCNIGG